MIYDVGQHTSTASCIDILATSPLCSTGSCVVSFRIESSEEDEVPGPNLVPGQNLGNNLENTAAI
jgi:hypothetical protein